jgi:hypothetical protein
MQSKQSKLHMQIFGVPTPWHRSPHPVRPPPVSAKRTTAKTAATMITASRQPSGAAPIAASCRFLRGRQKGEKATCQLDGRQKGKGRFHTYLAAPRCPGSEGVGVEHRHGDDNAAMSRTSAGGLSSVLPAPSEGEEEQRPCRPTPKLRHQILAPPPLPSRSI